LSTKREIDWLNIFLSYVVRQFKKLDFEKNAFKDLNIEKLLFSDTVFGYYFLS